MENPLRFMDDDWGYPHDYGNPQVVMKFVVILVSKKDEDFICCLRAASKVNEFQHCTCGH